MRVNMRILLTIVVINGSVTFGRNYREEATPKSNFRYNSRRYNYKKVVKPAVSPSCLVTNHKEWIPLLDNPCDFLSGPKCDGSPKERIAVVGAGMAGLTMSWILQHIGHEVMLLEASDRIGGRVYTYYGDGWYGDLGAMRFPDKQIQPLIHFIIKKFLGENALAYFTNYNQGPASYFYVNEIYFTSNEYQNDDQAVLKKLYKIFGVDISDPFLKNPTTGNLTNPSTILQSKLFQPESEQLPLSSCLNPESLESFLRRRLKKLGGPQRLVDMLSVLSLERASLPFSLWEYLNDEPVEMEEKERSKRNAGETLAQFTEIRNGTAQLPHKIFQEITSNKNVAYSMNSRVTGLYSTTYASQVKINNNGMEFIESVDKVVIATTSKAASLMKFEPSLPYDKKYALDTFHYMLSVKIYIHFTEPFWNLTKSNGNKIQRIPYGCLPNDTIPVRCGGTGITDLSMRSIYYPSNILHGTSLLVSYVWADDAARLASIPEAALIKRALDDLGQIHGYALVHKAFNGNYKIMKWTDNEYVGSGAFPWAYPFQNQFLLEGLRKHRPPVYFAGEYTEKNFHSWIQAAVASACRVSWDMFGDPKKTMTKQELIYP